jgi:hypothetical protein
VVIYILSYNTFVISFLEDRNLIIKSNATDFYAFCGTGIDCNKPYDICLLALFLLYRSYVTNRRSLYRNRELVYWLRAVPWPVVSSGFMSEALSCITGFYTWKYSSLLV